MRKPNNEVYEVLLRGVRSYDHNYTKPGENKNTLVEGLKDYILMYGHSLYDLHNTKHILQILDMIPSFVDTLFEVYGCAHPQISNMGLSEAVRKIEAALWGKETSFINSIKNVATNAVFVDGSHHKQKALCDILKLIMTEEEYKNLEIEDEGI